MLVINHPDRFLALAPLHPIVRSVIGDLDDFIGKAIRLSFARLRVSVPKPAVSL